MPGLGVALTLSQRSTPLSTDITATAAELPDHDTLNQWAKQLGFDAVAVTDVDLSVHEPHVKNWLAQGFAGDMGYLHRNLEKRLHPELLETETCRVISARMNYLPPDTQPLEVLANSETGLCFALRVRA